MTCPALHSLRGSMGRDDHGRQIEPRHVTVPIWIDPRFVGQCVHCRSVVEPGPGVVTQESLRKSQP